MTAFSLCLHAAIHQKLVDDTALGALVSGVFDHVPVAATMPYVTLRPGQERAWSAKDFRGAEATYFIDVWSAAAGRAECLAIMAAVVQCLDDAALTPEGVRLVLLRHEFSELLADAVSGILHGVLRFRALMHEA